MGLSHLAIATNGLAPKIFSHLQFALFGWASIEVIVTPIPSGGGALGDIYDRYDITIIIHWNGKVIRRSYTNVIFDTVIEIVAKIKEMSISIKHHGTSIISTVFGTTLNSVKVNDINVNIKEKPLNIKAKRK